MEHANQGRLTEARRLLTEAEARAASPNIRGRIAGTSAYLVARSGNLTEAMRIGRDALGIPGLDSATTAILSGQLGAPAEQAGRLDEAERWLTRGIDALDGEPLARANLLMNRSLVNMRRLRLEAARADTAAASGIFRDLGLDIDRAQAQHNEGYVALLAGDVIRALRLMGAARSTLLPLSPVAAAICDVDRAEVLRDAGLTTEAEHILAQAAVTFGRHRIPQSRAEAEFNLARSQLTHEPALAARTAAAATRRFRGLGNETWAARADAVRLRALLSGGSIRQGGGTLEDPRRVPDAAEVAEAASVLAGLGFAGEAAALRMTRELWRARRGEAPEPGPVRVPRSASIEVRLLADELRAARAAMAGRPAEARRHAASGLDLLGGWQSAFGSLDLQTSVVMHGRGLILAGLDSAVRSGRPEVIFEWSERARHLSQQVVPLRPPPDSALADDLAELRMLRADDPGWMSLPRAAELRERARERQWTGTGAREVQRPIGLERLRAELDPDTALIAYVYSGTALTALVVTADGEAVLPLEQAPAARAVLPGLRADLDMSASVRAGPLAAVVRRSLDDRLATLSTALLDAPAAVAGTRRLVITTPGVLSDIPWAMLPAMRGRAFTLATSATRWAAARGSIGPDPVVARSAGFAVGPRVARGEEEAAAAASAWPAATVLRGGEATVDAVTVLAGDVEVLHVAAHGRHAIDNPLFSGFELADGALFGYDIDRAPRVPRTIVLSACEVGRSSIRWGEEAIGMTRVWLHAGARCVVATPVIVADDVACELLGAMHEGLAAGIPPAEALAAASDRTGLVAPFQSHGAGF